MNIIGDLFSTVNLTCIAGEGYPKPEISWYKDGTKLNTPSTSNSLVFEELRPSDRGFYYCEAVNVAGTATSDTVLVNIQGLYVELCTLGDDAILHASTYYRCSSVQSIYTSK